MEKIIDALMVIETAAVALAFVALVCFVAFIREYNHRINADKKYDGLIGYLEDFKEVHSRLMHAPIPLSRRYDSVINRLLFELSREDIRSDFSIKINLCELWSAYHWIKLIENEESISMPFVFYITDGKLFLVHPHDHMHYINGSTRSSTNETTGRIFVGYPFIHDGKFKVKDKKGNLVKFDDWFIHAKAGDVFGTKYSIDEFGTSESVFLDYEYKEIKD